VRLLIVRHAVAVARGTRGLSDTERPLTKQGAADFAKAARGLARVLPRPDAVLTSPLPRARQTAEIALVAWKSPARVVAADSLAEVAPAPVAKVLARHRRLGLVAVFGHEPGVSSLLAYLVGAGEAAGLGFRKGGAALVETPHPGRRGTGRLVWFLPPKLLSALGGGR
jgi:phosphohistidine phosphatase